MSGLSNFENPHNNYYSFENMDKNELLLQLEKYKEDNRIIYQNYKKLENENIELFFANKENKFYYKLIFRMLQYHIKNEEAKNIINKLVMLNGKAMALDLAKNKIKIKIDDINLTCDNSISNQELEELKQNFSNMEKELNDKYIILKNLDKELKKYE